MKVHVLFALSLLIFAPLVDASWWCFGGEPLVCNFKPTDGYTTRGRVVFRSVFDYRRWSCMVHIEANFTGLNQNSLQGWHIHQYGDVGEIDGSGTGGHFISPNNNPWRLHALPPNPRRHWGDLGNLQVTSEGTANFTGTDDIITLRGIVGRGMIIHAGRDKGIKFQPSGASGARAAQCVIGIANSAK